MPQYRFEHKETNEQIVVDCKSDDLDEMRNALGHEWRQVWQMNISYSGVKSLISHTDSGWKDTLKAIKKANPGNTIRD